MKHSQNGFTLVELAIVLMIIGLLIGGILKGQELIENARITSLMRQITSYETAVTTFRDSYAALPGDMLSPGTRIPNCGATPTGAACSTAGNNNGILGDSGVEHYNFWQHLAKTNMISGVDISSADTIPPKQVAGSGVFTIIYNGMVPGNNYFLSGNGGSSGSLSNRQASRIDRKMDDGKPYTGDMRAENDSAIAGNTSVNCETSAIYEENSNDTLACFFYIKSQ